MEAHVSSLTWCLSCVTGLFPLFRHAHSRLIYESTNGREGILARRSGFEAKETTPGRLSGVGLCSVGLNGKRRRVQGRRNGGIGGNSVAGGLRLAVRLAAVGGTSGRCTGLWSIWQRCGVLREVGLRSRRSHSSRGNTREGMRIIGVVDQVVRIGQVEWLWSGLSSHTGQNQARSQQQAVKMHLSRNRALGMTGRRVVGVGAFPALLLLQLCAFFLVRGHSAFYY